MGASSVHDYLEPEPVPGTGAVLRSESQFREQWPELRRRIESLRLKALDVYLADVDPFNACRARPNMEQIHGALLLGVQGGDLDRILTRVQCLADTMDVIESFPVPATPEGQVPFLLGVIDDLLDALFATLQPWVNLEDRAFPPC